MKGIQFCILSLLILWAAYCQAQQKVHSIIKVQYEQEWYIEQAELWEKSLAKNTQQPDGWLNYYTAVRMAKILSKDSETRQKWLDKMDAVVAEVKEKLTKDDYEYHYIQCYHETEHQKGIEHSLKAYEIDPTRPDTYDELVTYYERIRDKTKLTEIAKKWKASGDIPPTVMRWNYNMLASTEENAILITYGDYDTYPALVLQHADNFRKDVTVMNSSLITLEEYRNKLFKALAIPPLEGKQQTEKAIVAHIIKHKGDLPLYFGIAGNHKALDVADKLFNVGLAMKYSEDSFGDAANSFLINNFENNILLDHLIQTPWVEAFPESLKYSDMLYVPGLLGIYKHYHLIGNCQRANKAEKMLLKIANRCDRKEYILDFLKQHNKNKC